MGWYSHHVYTFYNKILTEEEKEKISELVLNLIEVYYYCKHKFVIRGKSSILDVKHKYDGISNAKSLSKMFPTLTILEEWEGEEPMHNNELGYVNHYLKLWINGEICSIKTGSMYMNTTIDTVVNETKK